MVQARSAKSKVLLPSLTIIRTCVLVLIAWGIFPMSAYGADQAIVSRVVDGDTLAILLHGQAEKVRLIGVDTPELHESEKLHRDAQRTGQDVTLFKLSASAHQTLCRPSCILGVQLRCSRSASPRSLWPTPRVRVVARWPHAQRSHYL